MKLRCMAGILLLLLTAPLAAVAAGGNTIYRHIESTGESFIQKLEKLR